MLMNNFIPKGRGGNVVTAMSALMCVGGFYVFAAKFS